MIRFEGVKKVYPGNGKTPDLSLIHISITGSGMIVYGAYLHADEDAVSIAQHLSLIHI